MATFTKTQGTAILATQSVASNTVVISSVQDVATKMAATVGIRFGRRSASALTAGVEIRIEASMASSGDGEWYPLATFLTASVAAEAEAVSGTVSAGTNVITVASTTNLTAGDLVFIDNTTIGNSEWGRVKAISTNTSITIEDNLANAQTGATIYDTAEFFVAQLDLSSVGRLRLVVDAKNTGVAVAVKATMVTADSIG
jgi:hypothetical protein